jgi:capsular exopolysaccharide synthesis family protein
MVQEQLSSQFGSPEDVERLLGPQLLAIIPDFNFTRNPSGWQRLLPSYRPAGGEIGLNGGGEPRAITLGPLPIHGGDSQAPPAYLIAKWQPSSIAAEQYRIAATRLTLVRSKERSTIVAVTSAIKGEGKTTTVVNLGYTLARDLGKRTVLVDCDFRCPVLHLYADSVSQRGFADCLSGESGLEEGLSSFEEVSCSILPVGNCESPSNYLLKTEQLSSIFSQLRKRFDYILLNTPPILALADMNILATHADVLLLVVRANMASRQMVTRAVGSLGTDKPMYSILNGVKEQSSPYYYYYSYKLQEPRLQSRADRT